MESVCHCGFLTTVSCRLSGSWVHPCMLSEKRICFLGDIVLQLRFQFVNFISEICDDILVSGNVLRDQLLVWFNPHLDVLCTVRILQSVDGLFVLVRGWGDCSDHHSLAIASK